MPIAMYDAVSFETLWTPFVRQVAEPQIRPLARETIVVPASGWESYFTRRLATQSGCWANYEFVTMGGWLARTLGDFIDPAMMPLRDVEALTWAIAARLPSLLSEPEFSDVRAYLSPAASAPNVQQLVDLSRCLAGLFDQYMLYRPQLAEAWQRGHDWPTADETPPRHARWQRKLWTALAESLPLRSLRSVVCDLDKELNARVRSLPERVSVWVCGGVTPLHLDFLEVMGRYSQIGLYVISPSQEFWADMSGRKQLMRQLHDSGETARVFCEQNHIELMHPLLDSWGRLSQERQLLLAERESEPWEPRGVDPVDEDDGAAPTTLGRIQRGVCAARQPERADLSEDRSLRIHSCHGAVREVEVLRDQIRDALECDPTLQPEDFVVMSPDLQTYAPLVQAVFGSPARGQPGHIPFHIAGRSPRRTRPIIEVYFKLLEALQGRLSVSEVLDLLAAPALSEKFEIDEQDLETITDWVRDSKICWGIDGDHRRDEAVPVTDLNTWRFGLDRLLMGYAMPPGGQQLVSDIVALDRVEGLSGDTLGKLCLFLDRLEKGRESLKQERRWEEWRQPLGELVGEMLSADQDETGVQRLFDAIDQIIGATRQGGFELPVSGMLVCRELNRHVEQMAGGGAFQMGGITFCEMTAMRSLPFKVVALLGMKDGTFPRSDRSVAFDLTKQADKREPGDRSARLEDKHLFLEALLAARERLIITYQGQTTRDARPLPPSVAVEELLDAVEQSFVEGAAIRKSIVVRHPLQPFSPRYFTAESPELFSYDASNAKTALALRGDQAGPRMFVTEVLPDEGDLSELRVRDLQKLLSSPWELLLERLGVRLDDSEEAGSDREPLLLNELEKWEIGDAWLREALTGDAGDFPARCRRSGVLPGGPLGRQVLSELQTQVDTVVDTCRKSGVGTGGRSLPVRLEIGGVKLLGRVRDYTPEGIRRASYSSLNSSVMHKKLQLWLDYLLATAISADPGCSAVLVGRENKNFRIKMSGITPEDAVKHLATLINLYRLSRRWPLPFFAKSDNVMKVLNSADLDSNARLREAVVDSRRAYKQSSNYGSTAPSQADQPAVKAAFAGRDPFEMKCREAPGFEALADNPLFIHLYLVICKPMEQATRVDEADGGDS